MADYTIPPDTLFGYDMVLAISQQSVNDQFGLLFNHRPEPRRKPSRYLMDHEINLGYRLLNQRPGFLPMPPYLDSDYGDNAYRKLRMVIPLRCGWLKILGARYFFSHWEMSWICSIGRRDVPDINDARLHYSGATDAINEAKKEAATSGIDPATFDISSIFCLSEEAGLADTFRLDSMLSPQDDPWTALEQARLPRRYELFEETCPLEFPKIVKSEDGKPKFEQGIVVAQPVDAIKEKAIEALLETIKTRGAEWSHQFLLGYALTKKPNLKENAQQALFAPQSYQIRVTPNSDPRLATLNYCLLDRDHDAASVDAIERDDNHISGVIADSLFDRVSKGDLQASAILALSRRSFFREVINRMLWDKIWINPDSFIQGNSSVLGLHTERPSEWAVSQGVMTMIPHHVGRTRQQFSFGISSEIADTLLHVTAFNLLSVLYSSTLSAHPGDIIDRQSPRRLYIYLSGTLRIQMTIESTMPIVGGEIAKVTSVARVQNATEAERLTDTSFTATFALTAADSGEWGIDDAEPPVVRVPDRDGSGYKWDTSTTYSDSLIGLAGQLVSKFSNGEQQFANMVHVFDELSRMGGRKDALGDLSKALNGLTNKIVLPAGDSFFYNGIDTDDEGHLYSHLTYKTRLNDYETPATS